MRRANGRYYFFDDRTPDHCRKTARSLALPYRLAIHAVLSFSFPLECAFRVIVVVSRAWSETRCHPAVSAVCLKHRQLHSACVQGSVRSRAYYTVVTLHFHCAHADPVCLPNAVPLSQQRGAGFRIAVFLLESPPPVDSCQTCNRHPGLRRLQRQGEVLCTLLAAYEGKHFLATVASLDHR